MAITANPTVQSGAVLTGQGAKSLLNVSAKTLIKNVKGRIVRVNVIVAGSTNGAVYDSATSAGTADANAIAAIPMAVGSYLIDFPCNNGIVFMPGTDMVATISYN